MPWIESDPVSERLEFVRRWEQGERVVDLCHEFGISRKTAYKMRERYEALGARGLFDRSHAPRRIPHRTPADVEKELLLVREAHPTWGPKKIQAWLLRGEPAFHVPCPSTIGEILQRRGVMLRKRQRRRGVMPNASPLRSAGAPNEIWCADFKGEFRLGTGRYCYPLTITDRFSRFLIRCEALEGTHVGPAMEVFEQAFREFGLPRVIRTDNGTPFASTGLWALSRLSVRWLRLGIWPERIEPSHPEQNGQHERMHLVLKEETTRPAGDNLLQQQERFDKFQDTYNHDRPHEALGQRPPADFYVRSQQEVPESLPELDYPMHDRVELVRNNGDIFLPHRQRTYLSTVLAGQRVGLREVADGCWLVSFMHLDLGHYDARTKAFVALEPEPGKEVRTDVA